MIFLLLIRRFLIVALEPLAVGLIVRAKIIRSMLPVSIVELPGAFHYYTYVSNRVGGRHTGGLTFIRWPWRRSCIVGAPGTSRCCADVSKEAVRWHKEGFTLI